MDDPNDPQNWSPLHCQVEAFNKLRDLMTGPKQRIPESLVRRTLAEQHGCQPDDITSRQINLEVASLLRYYPAIELIPTEPVTVPSSRLRALDDDYQVIEFDGKQYELTPTQSTVIRILHKAHLDKSASVGVSELHKAMGVHSGRMSQWFRGQNTSLYGKLVVQSAGRYHYRLDI
jgi:hypothetical protein